MVFDSPEVLRLVQVYDDEPDFMVPEIVFLARNPRAEGDRAAIERLVLLAPERKRNDWLGRLTSADHAQFKGAWFEIMLFEWLQDVGRVRVEPEIQGCRPDFAVQTPEHEIAIEAHTLLESRSARDYSRFEAGIFWALSQIRKDHIIQVVAAQSSGLPDWQDLQEKVGLWLETSPSQPFTYATAATTVVMEIHDIPGSSSDHIRVFGPTHASGPITGEPVKASLRQKAHQHAALRKARYPYVIALLIEPMFLSAEEAAKAWFGEEQWVINVQLGQVVEIRSDMKGIHFLGEEVRHTTVSGTLVFKSEWDEGARRTVLKSWYIENPFSQVALNPYYFTTVADYRVQEKGARGFTMAWRQRSVT